MTRDEIIEELGKIEKNHRRQSGNFIRKNKPDLVKEIAGYCDIWTIHPEATVSEIMYALRNNVKSRPICPVCGKAEVSFHNSKGRYNATCSAKCGRVVMVAHSAQTRFQKYGAYSPQDFASKVKKTKLQRHGSETYVNANKRRKTMLSRYGVENPLENKDILDKMANTKLERYGNSKFNNREKFKETVSAFTDERKNEINRKRAETNLERYGTYSIRILPEVKEKIKNTCLAKYGVSSTFEIQEVRDSSREALRRKAYQAILQDKFSIPLFSCEEYVKITKDNEKSPLKFKCKTCGKEFEAYRYNGRDGRCPDCYPPIITGTSNEENDVAEFVEGLLGKDKVERNTKSVISPLELDIYIPEKRIGIEFNGLYWHSRKVLDDTCSRTRHLEKTEKCAKAGIRLIHVFEDEWIDGQKIVKARLKAILGKTRYRIPARKCWVDEISPSVKERFLRKYHLQGGDKSSVRLGLFYGNRLVAVMTFSKARFTDKCEWELSRYATVANFTIVGGAGKLLSHFERRWHPKSLVTYADRRWSNGYLYGKLGFIHDHTSAPNYWYVKDMARFSRVGFQKHKLKTMLKNFNPGLSETANVLSNGYWQIFDCGNLVYVKKYM